MALISRSQIQQNLVEGKGTVVNFVSAQANGTSAAQASGWHVLVAKWPTVGTVIGTTYLGAQLPPTPSAPLRLIQANKIGTLGSAGGAWWRLYKVGSVVLSTGVYTHDAATFPATRTQLGQAAQPLSLVPFIHVTVATATTAPVCTFTYTNQDGGSIVGAKTITFPAAVTAANSTFMMRLEDGDSGVRNISAMNFSVTASAGNADIYLGEFIAPYGSDNVGAATFADTLYSGLTLTDLVPAASTAGTFTTYLIPMSASGTNDTVGMNLLAVQDA